MLDRSRYWVLLLPASLIVGGVVLYFVTSEKATWLPPCLFHKFTGLYCPGCGTTRGLHALLHGHVLAALRFNVITIAALPVLVYAVAKVAWLEITGTKPQPKPLPVWVPWAIAFVIGIFWIARNIPAYPFTLLAPH